MKKTIGIWGWWQGHNLGDNWIKHILKDFFPEAVFLPTTVQDFSAYDYIICGGGGLFIYDVIAPFDKMDMKMPFGILGLGAEFEHETRRAAELEEKADFFYVRDQYSLECMHLPDTSRSFDLTFLEPLPFAAEKEIDWKKLFFVWRDGHELLRNEKFKEYIQYSDAEEAWRKCIDRHFEDIVENDFQTSEWDVLASMENCGFVISGRYHGIVAAIQRGLPFVAIDICPKIRALLEECGLEEFCVKISETDKIENLMKKAKEDIQLIREKERSYIANARTTLMRQMQEVKRCIVKAIYPVKVLHYGSYWMGENDVVHAMADDLALLGDASVIDLRAYSASPDKRIDSIEKTPNGSICRLNTERIMKDIEQCQPDAVVLNAGGLCMEKDLLGALRERKIVSVGISLSDPDVYPYNGKVYGSDFSLFYTNSKYSFINQYDSSSVNIRLLPFAASMKHHYYMPEIEKIYDLVIVGHARQDRIEAAERLKKVCRVGLYGYGWKDGNGSVNGLEHVKAINSGKMYLSFSHTQAGFDNVKVGLFEAMACNQLVITSYMEELKDYFEIGKEIVCYRSLEELEELVAYYLAHEYEREQIRNAGYMRFLKEHTYQNRWESIMRDIYEEM